MKSTILNKFIKSVILEDPSSMAESFNKLMNEKLNKIYETKVVELAKTFFNLSEAQEVFSYELSNALVYVVEGLKTSPISLLPTLMAEASTKFGAHVSDIAEALREAVETEDEKIQYEPIHENFLKSLNTIITESRPCVLEFKNKTARKITVDEASDLAKMYSKLESDQKIQMVEKMVESRLGFEGLLKFSLSESFDLTESWIAHLNNGNRTGYHDSVSDLMVNLHAHTPYNQAHGAAIFHKGVKQGHYDASNGGITKTVNDIGQSHTSYHPEKVAEINKWKDAPKKKHSLNVPLKKESFDLNEAQPILQSPDADKIHGLLNRFGYKLDHTASKLQKAKVYKHISNGQSVRVGDLDSLTSIQNHIDGLPKK
jgi:hypothetical protein